MKAITAVIIAVLIFSSGVTAQKKSPKTQKEKVSYSIGVNIGRNLKKQNININADMLARGMKDAFSGATLVMSEKDMETTLKTFQQEMMTKMEAQRKVVGEKNKKEGEAFLSANKNKEGVITLPSGLQYKVITNGTGSKPTKDQTVKVHYRGTLIDGSEFDSSYKRGEPVEFPVGQVIAGWVEALQMMSVGSKWQLFIPSDLAYGEQGNPRGGIGPNAVLIFDVELVSIK